MSCQPGGVGETQRDRTACSLPSHSLLQPRLSMGMTGIGLLYHSLIKSGLSNPTMLCKYTARTEFGGPCDTQYAQATLRQPTLGQGLYPSQKQSPPWRCCCQNQLHVYWRPIVGLPTEPMSNISTVYIVKVGTSQTAASQ